eukprot:XP_001704499.1 Hypothetical protein GL50803_116972 [Giardia lamblia ATCC 50803]
MIKDLPPFILQKTRLICTPHLIADAAGPCAGHEGHALTKQTGIIHRGGFWQTCNLVARHLWAKLPNF